MADLPRQRCQPDQRPFTCVGVDVFGQFYVIQACSQVKIYGCVFRVSLVQQYIEMLPMHETDV